MCSREAGTAAAAAADGSHVLSCVSCSRGGGRCLMTMQLFYRAVNGQGLTAGSVLPQEVAASSAVTVLSSWCAACRRIIACCSG
jgi:hypothetical protein